MPRISKEAVSRRETLARTLFKEGKTAEQVQAALMKVDVGGGRMGLKMAPGRLAELELEVKGKVDKRPPDRDTGMMLTKALAPDKEEAEDSVIDMASGDDNVHGGTVPSSGPDRVDTSFDSVAPVSSDGQEGMAPTADTSGTVHVSRCVVGTSYKDLEVTGTGYCLTGKFTGVDAGLYCFEMDDGRVFKLWNNERVGVV